MTATTTEKQSPTLTIQCQFCQTWNRIDAARAADRPKCGKCARPILLDRPLKLTDETFDRTIATFADPDGRNGAFVAEEGGRVVGFASFCASRDEDAPEGTGEVPAIYVHLARGPDGTVRVIGLDRRGVLREDEDLPEVCPS